MKEEAEKQRAARLQHSQQLAQAQRSQQKDALALKKLQGDKEKQDVVMRRKQEELNAAQV